jgi:hypothetical protein
MVLACSVNPGPGWAAKKESPGGYAGAQGDLNEGGLGGDEALRPQI